MWDNFKFSGNRILFENMTLRIVFAIEKDKCYNLSTTKNCSSVMIKNVKPFKLAYRNWIFRSFQKMQPETTYSITAR